MYKLLIADDEYEIRNGLFRYFPWNDVGFEAVGQVENGKQAIDFIKNNPVDIILCDIMMPIMTGLEMAEYLHREHPEIKICFLTAYKDFSFAQKAVSLNAIQYVLKSSNSAELLDIFRKIKPAMDEDRMAKAAPASFPAFPLHAGNGEAEQVPMADLYSCDNVNGQINRIIAEIRQYVYKHYATANLEEIAQIIYMSPNYISKIFKQKTKQNFSDFLLQVRMEKSAELLLDLRYKIYEVSEMVGYKYVKNFSRTFKEYYKVSPREFHNGKPLQHPGR